MFKPIRNQWIKDSFQGLSHIICCESRTKFLMRSQKNQKLNLPWQWERKSGPKGVNSQPGND